VKLRQHRPFARARATALLGVLVLLGLLGCRAATRTVIPPEERPLPAMTESRSQLLERIAGLQEGIATLTGTSVRYLARGLGLNTGVLAEYRETEGVLLVQRPDHIRMRGTGPIGLGTIFDMVSDRETFQVWAPTENEFITGGADSAACAETAILNLRPQHVMDSLFVGVGPYLNDRSAVTHTLEVVAEGRRSFYVLSFIDVRSSPASLLEKIWVDRLELSVARKQLFGQEGVPHTNVAYSEWEEVDGGQFPRRILVERPAEDYSLEIIFQELRTNDVPVEGAFVLSVPAGVSVREVGSDPDECQN
jgi:hypothetical protein